MPAIEIKEPWTVGSKKVEFWVIRGEVMSVMNDSTSNVHSESGGGWMSANGWIANAPVIRTTTHRSGAFWLRDAEGKEFQIDTADTHLPLRTGHKVAVLLCGRSPQPEKDSLTCAVVNYTTDQYCAVLGPAALDARMTLTWRVGCLVMIGIPVILWMGSRRGGDPYVLLAMIISLIAVTLLARIRRKQARRSLSKHIVELCKSI